MKKERQSNFELLRIVSMLMIIGNHMFRHGVIHAETEAQYILWQSADTGIQMLGSIFLPGGRVGVAVFFMITGFFAYNKENGISVKKVLLTSIDYGLILGFAMILANIFHIYTFGWGTIIANLLLPVMAGLGWFVSAYIILGLLSERMNRILSMLNRRGLLLLIVIVWALDYSLGNVLNAPYYNLTKAFLFYLIGYSLHEIDPIITNRTNRINKAVIIVFLLSWLGIVFVEFKTGLAHFQTDTLHIFLNKLMISSILVPMCAISLLVFFRNLKLLHHHLINTIGSKTFPVYLIHDSQLGRYLFWNRILRTEEIWKSAVNNPRGWVCLFLVAFISIVMVFAICMGIDYLRCSLMKHNIKRFQNTASKLMNILKKGKASEQ